MSGIEEEIQAFVEKSKERTIAGNYAHWNALLTMNTIIIAIFTAGLAYLERSQQMLLVPLIALGIASAGLLITNFRVSRDNWKYLGELAMGRAQSMSDNEREEDLNRANKRHNWIVRREQIVEVITFLQGVLIVFIVLYIAFSDRSNTGLTSRASQCEITPRDF